MPQEDQQIGGYTLIRKLGRGGFGEVWLAERRTELVTTQVALKFSLNQNIDLEIVKNEALVWVKASGHPNVLPIIEANIYDGHVVIVSEYAPDGSLEELLKKLTLLPTRTAIELTMGVLSGLQFLHSKQIIHRDIKPANVLLQGETPRLSDFGVSRLAKNTASLSQNVAGTPSYMSPETFDGKRNAQTDIWAVGVMLYQMLTGKLPFPQEETTELLGAIIMKEPQPLPDFVPQSLKNIVGRALAKNTSERYQTAEQMRQDLFQVFAQTPDNSNAPTYQAQVTTPQNAPEVTPFHLVNQTLPLNPPSQITAIQPKPVKKSSNLLIILGGVFALVLLLIGAAGTGVYYLVKSIRVSPTPSYTPIRTPWQTPTVTPTPKVEILYDSNESIQKVIALMEEKARGKLKLVDFNIGPDYVFSLMQDPNIAENYDRYTYRNGAIQKTIEKVLPPSEKNPAALFSTVDVNWEAIPNLVKAAKEKAADLEGAKTPIVHISRWIPFSKEIKIRVSISGTRKNLDLEADAKGKIKKLEIE